MERTHGFCTELGMGLRDKMKKKRVTCIQCGKDMILDHDGKIFRRCHCPKCHYAVYVEAENHLVEG